MALDEPRENDRQETAAGIVFLLDSYALQFASQLDISYDEEWDDFVIRGGQEPGSAC